MKNSAVKIKELVSENQKIFQLNLKSVVAVKNWYSYLQYIDDIVYKSILQIIATSLAYILDETDTKKNSNLSPLFDLKLELCEPDIIFQPSIDKTMVGNFFDVTSDIMNTIFEMSKLVPRIAFRKGFPSYLGM